MSSAAVTLDRLGDGIESRPRERARAAWGMGLFIATEATLFALLFFGYFYLAASKPRWPLEEDPSYFYALILLGVLLTSSLTLHWGQRGLERQNALGRFNLGVGVTIALGIAFLVIQYFEYRHHLMSLTPVDSSYGSIFCTITTFHMAHVIMGLLMLVFVFALGLKRHFAQDRMTTVKNVAYYWHFVDLIWVLVVAILYLSPQFYGPP